MGGELLQLLNGAKSYTQAETILDNCNDNSQIITLFNTLVAPDNDLLIAYCFSYLVKNSKDCCDLIDKIAPNKRYTLIKLLIENECPSKAINQLVNDENTLSEEFIKQVSFEHIDFIARLCKAAFENPSDLQSLRFYIGLLKFNQSNPLKRTLIIQHLTELCFKQDNGKLTKEIFEQVDFDLYALIYDAFLSSNNDNKNNISRVLIDNIIALNDKNMYVYPGKDGDINILSLIPTLSLLVITSSLTIKDDDELEKLCYIITNNQLKAKAYNELDAKIIGDKANHENYLRKCNALANNIAHQFKSLEKESTNKIFTALLDGNPKLANHVCLEILGILDENSPTKSGNENSYGMGYFFKVPRISKKTKSTKECISFVKKALNQFASLYDWNDDIFRHTFNSYFCQAFKTVDSKEQNELLSLYVNQFHKTKFSYIRECFNTLLEQDTSYQALIANYFIKLKDNFKLTEFIYASPKLTKETLHTLLNQFSNEDLVKLCPTILGMSQLIYKEDTHLEAYYLDFLTQKISDNPTDLTLLTNMVEAFFNLPLAYLFDVSNKIKHKLDDKPEIKVQFLKLSTLRQRQNLKVILQKKEKDDKELSYYSDDYEKIDNYIVDSLANLAKQKVTLTPCLEELNDEQLLAYFNTIKDSPVEQSYLSEVISTLNTRKQFSLLVDILINSTDLTELTISQIVHALPDINLVDAIKLLDGKSASNDAYSSHLKTLLICYSAKLRDNAISDTSIHHTVDELLSSSHIALKLLSIPECFLNLVTSSQWLGNINYYLTSNARIASDFEYRIVKLLNTIESNEGNFKNAVLALLIDNKSNSKAIYDAFCYLNCIEKGSSSLNKQGKESLALLKETLFFILCPKKEYNEDVFWKAVNNLSNQESYNSVYSTLAKQDILDKNPSLSAHYFAQIKGDISNIDFEWDIESITTLLVHSYEDKTLANWETIADLLVNKEAQLLAKLFKNLITNVFTPSKELPQHSQIKERLAQFIILLTEKKGCHGALSADELNHIVPYLDAVVDKQILLKWLSSRKDSGAELAQLIQLHTVRNTNLDRSDIETLYDSELFNSPEKLAEIFNHIDSGKENSLHHYLSILFKVLTKDRDFKIGFLSLVHQNIDYKNQNPQIIAILNKCLLDIERVATTNESLVEQHLEYLANSYLYTNGINEYKAELNQILLNTLNFCQYDSGAHRLLKSQGFQTYLLKLLQECYWKGESIPVDKNPLTTIFLQLHYNSSDLPKLIRTNDYYYEYIKSLFNKKTIKLNDDLYHIIFDSLPKQKKHQYALEILTGEAFTYPHLLSILSDSITIDELYSLYAKSQKKFIYPKLIFSHPRVHEELADDKKNIVLEELLENQSHLVEILDDRLAPQTKIKLVDTIFAYFSNDNNALFEWLKSLDSDVLVLVLNYSVNPQVVEKINSILNNKELLNKTLIELHINNFFANPQLDIPLNTDSVLYDLLKKSYTKPRTTNNIAPSFINKLSKKDATHVFSKKLTIANDEREIHSLIHTLIDIDITFLPEALASARWFNHLTLITEGLFEVIQFSRENQSPKDLKEQIERTTLYRTLSESTSLSIDSFNLAYKLLNDYVEELSTYDDEKVAAHCLKLKVVLDKFELQLSQISQDYNSTTDYLFRPNNDFSTIRSNGSVSKISETNADELFHTIFKNDKKVGAARSIANTLVALNKPTRSDTPLIIDSLKLNDVIHHLSDNQLKTLFQKLNLSDFESIKSKLDNEIKDLEAVHKHLKLVVSDKKSLYDAVAHISKFKLSTLELCASILKGANAPQLHALYCSIIKAKKLDISFQEYILEEKQTNNLELVWLDNNLEKIKKTESVLKHLLQDHMVYSLSHHKNGDINKQLAIISTHGIKLTNSQLATILASYQPLLTKNDEVSKGYLTTFASLLSGMNSKRAITFLDSFNPSFIETLLAQFLINLTSKDIKVQDEAAKLLDLITDLSIIFNKSRLTDILKTQLIKSAVDTLEYPKELNWQAWGKRIPDQAIKANTKSNALFQTEATKCKLDILVEDHKSLEDSILKLSEIPSNDINFDFQVNTIRRDLTVIADANLKQRFSRYAVDEGLTHFLSQHKESHEAVFNKCYSQIFNSLKPDIDSFELLKYWLILYEPLSDIKPPPLITISPGTPVYSQDKLRIGVITDNGVIYSNQQPVLHDGTYPAALKLFDENGSSLGFLSPQSRVCSTLSYRLEILCNCIQHFSLESIQSLPGFDRILDELIQCLQLADISHSILNVSQDEPKFNWLKTLFYQKLTDKEYQLSDDEAKEVVKVLNLEQCIDLKQKNNQTIIKALISNEKIAANIITENKTLFIDYLKSLNLSQPELLILKSSTKNPSIASIIASELYCIKNAKPLEGYELKQKISDDECLSRPFSTCTLSKTTRFKNEAKQFKIENISPSLLKNLSPEFAAELLLSPNIYPNVSNEQFKALLATSNSYISTDKLTGYFLSHHYQLPFFNQGVALFYNNANMLPVIEKLSYSNKTKLFKTILSQPELFETVYDSLINTSLFSGVTLKTLIKQFSHDDTFMAIRFYLSNKTMSENYKVFVHKLLSHWLKDSSNMHRLYDKSLNDFLTLRDDAFFTDLFKDDENLKKLELTLLQDNARRTMIEYFYDDGFVLKKALQPIEISSYFSDETHVEAAIIHYLKHISDSANHTRLHYLVTDFMEAITLKADASNYEMLTDLIDDKDVSDIVKDTIFQLSCKHTQVLNANLCKALYNYKKDAFIILFGNKADYDMVSSICSHLPSDDPVVAAAKKEARVEKECLEMSGWFVSFRRWFKRLINYPWSGFFKASPSLYVAPFEIAHSSSATQSPNSNNKIASQLTEADMTMQKVPRGFMTFNVNHWIRQYNKDSKAIDIELLIERITYSVHKKDAAIDDKIRRCELIEQLFMKLKSDISYDVLERNRELFSGNRLELIGYYQTDERYPEQFNELLFRCKSDNKDSYYQFTPLLEEYGALEHDETIEETDYELTKFGNVSNW
jgi:hypothetical protein